MFQENAESSEESCTRISEKTSSNLNAFQEKYSEESYTKITQKLR
jgi:hypothetical protein